MDTKSLTISQDSQCKQCITMVLTESEAKILHRFLTDAKRDLLYWPKVAEELRLEVWYSFLEVSIENESQEQGGEP